MNVPKVAFALLFAAGSVCAYAADSGDRTYADPACSARDVNPERCVINDGAPVRLGTTGDRGTTIPITSPGTSTGTGGTGTSTGNTSTSTPTLRRGFK